MLMTMRQAIYHLQEIDCNPETMVSLSIHTGEDVEAIGSIILENLGEVAMKGKLSAEDINTILKNFDSNLPDYIDEEVEDYINENLRHYDFPI